MTFNIGGLSFDVDKALGVVASLGGPGMAKGAILQYLEKRSAKDIYQFITQNKGANVWDMLHDDYKQSLYVVEVRTHVLNTISLDWVINTLREDRPDLASLAMNSGEVRQFLRKVIRDVKKGIAAYRPS